MRVRGLVVDDSFLAEADSCRVNQRFKAGKTLKAKKLATDRIVSLHWGYALGGVGKYGLLIDRMRDYVPIDVQHLCIRGRDWQCDTKTLAEINAIEILIRSRADVSWTWRLAGQLKMLKPKIVMTHGFNGHFAASLMSLLKVFPGTLVCSYHGIYHPTTPFRRLLAPAFNGFTEYYIRRRAQSAVAVAVYAKRYLISKRVDPDKITVIHNGIENQASCSRPRNDLRKEWNATEDDVVIGVASRIDPIKGITYLIAAFKEIADKHPRSRLVIVGAGPAKPSLQQQVKLARLGARVYFSGFRTDVDDCLAAFDVFVLPSLAESHSIALLEAMRAGKPIIATQVGGNTESVRDQQEALIVKPASIVALQDALDRILSDKDLRVRLASAAKDRFDQHFTEDKMLSQTAAWIRTLLNVDCALLHDGGVRTNSTKTGYQHTDESDCAESR